ncbi:hypothetical protein N180_02775 [Pedobacter antarcticus 4BY]|uniref:Uncharacterized protein n=2 Tax=Pedobacter antarcticus TaxID=34086 RepID=A0A081PKG6_9SPHI|nr:DUF6706 family protein [Pedobacter antarcticus]KEQ31189.1 hypothetical protein N180_02775 [Pedobacter antarcticus 4BY]SFE54412.1 hypothetical protein SAMN03003324_00843 [Pedobacter antarcticus]
MEELTIKEALTSLVDFTIPRSRVLKALIDANLDGSAIYNKKDEMLVDLCMAELLLSLLPYKRITEGGYTVELPSPIDMRIVRSALLKKWGIVEDDPEESSIEDISNKW